MNEIHDDSDLQKMEHSRLQNDLDQVRIILRLLLPSQPFIKCNYRSNERNNDLIERLEKMQDRIEALEIKQRKVETSNQRPILPGPLEKGDKLFFSLGFYA